MFLEYCFRDERGMSLIEVLIAITILAIVLIPVLGSFTNSDMIITDENNSDNNFEFEGAIITDSGYVKFALENTENAKFDKGTIDYSKIPSELFSEISLADYMDEKSSG